MMEIIIKPSKDLWYRYSQRPVENDSILNESVKSILIDVCSNGDEALIRLTEQFDSIVLNDLKVTKEELDEAIISEELEQALQLAKSNISAFHSNQKKQEDPIETIPGVKCWRETKAIEKIGLYIPGGSAPLFSTVLMLGIPAMLAGCKEVVLCTPPRQGGSVNPAILYAAKLAGIDTIYKVGGAQAIAAMTYGTETIPKVDKLFGPGNQYVTKAKELAQLEGVAIDMPAGPSEVLVIADDYANAEFVAADLLSQAEHGADSQVLLLSNSESFVNKVKCAITTQLKQLPRETIAMEALKNSRLIVLNGLETCMEFSNQYAPEHLIVNTSINEKLLTLITNAGSVFIGQYSPESAGDYASGTNHTLPTNRCAKNYSGVSLDSFQKQITFQEINKKGLEKIGNAIEIMAEAEQLMAHKNAVTIRLKNRNDEKLKKYNQTKYKGIDALFVR